MVTSRDGTRIRWHRAGDELLVVTEAVEIGSVEQGHAEIDDEVFVGLRAPAI